MRFTTTAILLFFALGLSGATYGAMVTPGVFGHDILDGLVKLLPPQVAVVAPVLPAVVIMTAFAVLRFIGWAITFVTTAAVVLVVATVIFGKDLEPMLESLDFKSITNLGGTNSQTSRSSSGVLTVEREELAAPGLLPGLASQPEPATARTGSRTASAAPVSTGTRVVYEARPAAPTVLRDGRTLDGQKHNGAAKGIGLNSIRTSDPIADLINRLDAQRD